MAAADAAPVSPAEAAPSTAGRARRNPSGDPRAVPLDAAAFAHGSVRVRSYARQAVHRQRRPHRGGGQDAQPVTRSASPKPTAASADPQTRRRQRFGFQAPEVEFLRGVIDVDPDVRSQAPRGALRRPREAPGAPSAGDGYGTPTGPRAALRSDGANNGRANLPRRSRAEQPLHQLLAGEVEVSCHVREDAAERTDTERVVML